MQNFGRNFFILGLVIAFGLAVGTTFFIGTICQLDPENPPQTILSYPALCFSVWAFGPPIGMILAATGALLAGGMNGRRGLAFAVTMIALYAVVTYLNDPIPHIPPAFGVGGTLILLFFGLILWTNRTRFVENRLRLAAYTLLVIGFWFACGMAARQYQPYFGQGQSPIDIMFYFASAMGLFWLAERKT